MMNNSSRAEDVILIPIQQGDFDDEDDCFLQSSFPNSSCSISLFPTTAVATARILFPHFRIRFTPAPGETEENR